MLNESDFLVLIQRKIFNSLETSGVAILPPMDVFRTIELMSILGIRFSVVMLDPWYNKGVGGISDEYDSFLVSLLEYTAKLSYHVFLWGFPEIIARIIKSIPEPLEYICWLTWYYKNNPSVIRGWRSAQQTCLHLARHNAKMYPEHFLNEKQLQLKKEGKLRYMPSPPSVIESALNIGFIGKKEQTGHPSQKPLKVYEPLLKMSTVSGDLVLDPMAGSGTAGVLSKNLGHKTILCDSSEEYTVMMEKRLNVKRLRIKSKIQSLF